MPRSTTGVVFNPQGSPQVEITADIDVEAFAKMVQDHVVAHLRNPRKREIEEMLSLCAIKLED